MLQNSHNILLPDLYPECAFRAHETRCSSSSIHSQGWNSGTTHIWNGERHVGRTLAAGPDLLVKGSDTSSYDKSGCSFSIPPSNVMNGVLVVNSFNPGSTLLASIHLIIVALDSHVKPPAIFHPNSLTPTDVQLAPQRPIQMTQMFPRSLAFRRAWIPYPTSRQPVPCLIFRGWSIPYAPQILRVVELTKHEIATLIESKSL